ncbi:MAG TPA: antibiotic biosynthesis monooxygenase [Actinomycetota bacterium]|nr:antibiotic biosynthesis monooxygenase [Actinomycetota bacterium]
MYGTVFHFQAKPDAADDVKALFAEWNRDVKPTVDGALNGFLYQLDSDPDRFIACAVFQDKASYMKNANSPEQDKWYQRFRDLLTGDPDWNDGQIS